MGNEPTSDYAEWITGTDKAPKLMRLQGQQVANAGAKKANFAAKLAGKPVPAATPLDNNDELAALRAEVARLKQ